jgi:hypothetical protein
MGRDMQNNKSEIIFITDSDWDIVDSHTCLVTDFNPLAAIKNGKVIAFDNATPYAYVSFECKKVSGNIKGYITQKFDFTHLWYVFKDRTVKENEEVIIIWSKTHYQNFIVNLFSRFMPKLWVMICPKDAYKLLSDEKYKPELSGEARYLATKAIVDLKPDVMK